MKNMLLSAIILLIIFIFYENRNLLQEGKKNRRGKGRRRKANKGSKKRKPAPFIAWDGDKYKSCGKCCGDDDGCYDPRCYGKCSKRSFKRSDGTKKRRPVKP